MAPREQAAEGVSDVGGAADSGGSGAEGGWAETTQNLGATAVTLDERVQRAWAGLMENDDFEPRGAQPATMRACLERRDCIVRAATGSGKTLAGVGPLLTFAFGLLVWFTPLVELAFETKAAIEELFGDRLVVLITCSRQRRGGDDDSEDEAEEGEGGGEGGEGAEVPTVGQVNPDEVASSRWSSLPADCESRLVVLITTMDAVNPAEDASAGRVRRAHALEEAIAVTRSLGRLRYMVHDEVDGAIRNRSWRWSYHDFDRPLKYIRDGSIVEGKGSADTRPFMLGITATLSPSQATEVQRALGFDLETELVLLPTDRTNLSYAVLNMLYFDGGYTALLRETARRLMPMLLSEVRSMIFGATRACVEIIAEHLRTLGVLAVAYHSDMGGEALKKAWAWWVRTPHAVLVSTSLAGTGRNEPSVSFVVHMTLRPRIEEMVQEWGRAGRAGQRATIYIAFHPLLLDKLAYFVDFEDSTMVGLLLDVLGLVAMHTGCRRQRTQQLLGDETYAATRCPYCNEYGLRGRGGGTADVGLEVGEWAGGGGGGGEGANAGKKRKRASEAGSGVGLDLGTGEGMDLCGSDELDPDTWAHLGVCDLCCNSEPGMPAASIVTTQNMLNETKMLLEEIGMTTGKPLARALREGAWRANLSACEANSLFTSVLLKNVDWLAPTTSQYKDTQGKQRTSKTLYVRTNGARSADVLTCRGAYPVVVWTQESTAGVERGDASEADLEFYWREVYDRGAAGCLGPAAGGHEWAEEKGQVLGAIFF